MGARAFIGLPIGVAIVVVLVAVTRCLPEPGGGIEWVQRPESILVQMKIVGGLPQTDVMDRATVPDFTLYGDGTLIFIRPSERGQLNRATLHKGTLSADAVRDLLTSITDTGFLAFNYSQPRPGVFDVPTTYLYANTKAAANAVSAYALDSAPPAGSEWDQFRRLREIKSHLDKIAADAIAGGAAIAYASDAILLLIAYAPPIAIPPPPEWPFPDIDLASIAPESGGVGERRVDGEAARQIMGKLIPYVAGFFAQNAHVFSVAYRPVLPYEENFPEFEPASGAPTP